MGKIVIGGIDPIRLEELKAVAKALDKTTVDMLKENVMTCKQCGGTEFKKDDSSKIILHKCLNSDCGATYWEDSDG